MPKRWYTIYDQRPPGGKVCGTFQYLERAMKKALSLRPECKQPMWLPLEIGGPRHQQQFCLYDKKQVESPALTGYDPWHGSLQLFIEGIDQRQKGWRELVKDFPKPIYLAEADTDWPF